jgi:hypothetical protein
MTTPGIPHIRVVVSVSAFVLAGFALVSGYVLGWTDDEVTKGNVIGTWVNFARLAVGFWLGSSSGGKAAPSHEAPQPVTVTNPPSAPIPTTDIPEVEFGKDDR